MLLQLPTLPQIPGANSVVETTCPQLSAIVGYVNTASTVCMTLELPTTKIRRHKNNYGHLLLKRHNSKPAAKAAHNVKSVSF